MFSIGEGGGSGGDDPNRNDPDPGPTGDMDADDNDDPDRIDPDDDPTAREADDLREQLRRRVRTVVPENGTSEDIVPGSDPADLIQLILDAEGLVGRIATADLPTLQGYAETEVPSIEARVEKGRRNVEARGRDADRIAEEESRIGLHDAALDGEKERLDEARNAVRDHLAKRPLTNQILKDAQTALDTAERIALEIYQVATQRSEERDRIARAVQEIKSDPGATEDEKSELDEARKKVNETLAATPLTDQVLQDAASALEKANQVASQIREAVEERRQERKRILSELEKIKDDPDAAEDEKVTLAEAVTKVTDTLDQTPLTDQVLQDARTLLQAVQKTAGELATAARGRRDTHDRIAKEGEAIIVAGVLPDQIEQLTTARKDLADALDKPVTADNNKIAQKKLDTLKDIATRVTDELRVLGDEQGINDLCAAAGIEIEDYPALEKGLGGRKAVLECRAAFTAQELGTFCKDFGGADALGPLISDLGGASKFKTLMTELGGSAALLSLVKDAGLEGKAIKKLCEDLGPKLMADMLKAGVSAQDVKALHTAIGDKAEAFKTLAKDAGLDAKPKAMMALFKIGCGGDPAKFQTLCEGFSGDDEDDKLKRQNLKGLVEKGGLGDAPEAFGAMLATGCDGDPAKLAELGGAFDTDERREGLARMLTDGGLAGKTPPPPLADTDVDAKCLAMMLKTGKGDSSDARAEALADLCGEMNEATCKELKTTLTEGGLGQSPEALGHVVGIGCDGKAAQLKEFTKAFKDPDAAKKLKQALTDGGLKGSTPPLKDGEIDPKCLGQILKDGAGPPPVTDADRMGKAATLLKGLDKTDCESFQKVLSEGGLGQAPEALGHVIGIGCGSDPATLKKLNTGLATEDARKGLARMLDKGGLKGKSGALGATDIDPKCLGTMLKTAGGQKPTGMSDADYATKCCTDFGTLCTGMDNDACMGLKKTMEDSGLCRDPEVLGHLVGTGCKADGAKLKKLTAELNKPNNGANLKNLLEKGGFGTLDNTGAANGTKKDCLAHLFEPGCDGDPAELTKLLTALNNTGANPNALSDLKGVMKTGELGQHPQVLGDFYKHGCLTAPDGPPDGKGAKNPKVLIDMIGEFRGGEAAKFKDLMTTGGFSKWDAGTGTSRLGSVMRYGLTPKNGAQDGKKLKRMYNSFKNSPDGDKVADLNTMMNALEAANDTILEKSQPGHPNQPGKGLRNVCSSPKHNNSPNELYRNFYKPLNAHGCVTVGMQRDDLIQNAASFELAPVALPAPLNSNEYVETINPASGAIDFRVGHACGRHTRKHQAFHLNNSSETTLYPRQVDKAGLKAMVVDALDNGTATFAPNQGPLGVRANGQPKNVPAQDVHDLPANGFQRCDIARGGETMRVGLAQDGGTPNVKITQFYPKPNNPPDPLVTFDNTDMAAMRNVLV